MATRRRIMKELDDMAKDTSSGMIASVVNGDNMTHLHGSFAGPPDTPYAGGTYIIDIQLPDNYPFVPPKMRFETRVWHPNISSQTGAICLDTLATKWSPVLTIKTALLSLQSLLAAPEPNDPQDAEVARQMLDHPDIYRAKAKEWAYQFAGAGGPGGMPELTKEERRKRELDGYDEDTVGKFTGDMGFDEARVVSALKRVGVSRTGGIGQDETARVVETLLE